MTDLLWQVLVITSLYLWRNNVDEQHSCWVLRDLLQMRGHLQEGHQIDSRTKSFGLCHLIICYGWYMSTLIYINRSLDKGIRRASEMYPNSLLVLLWEHPGFVGPPPTLTPAVRPSGLWHHLMSVCQWTFCFSRLPACSDQAVYKAVALMLHIICCPPRTDIQWPQKVFGHLSYMNCIALYIVTNGSLIFAHTIKNKGSMLPWRTFNIHGTFPFH